LFTSVLIQQVACSICSQIQCIFTLAGTK